MTADARVLARQRSRARAHRRLAVARGIVLVGLVLTICTAASVASKERTMENPGVAPDQTATVVERTDVEAEVTPEMLAEEVTETPIILPYTEADVEALTKTVYGEALITHSDMEMAAVVWCVLNRVDSPLFRGDSILEIVTAPRQFHGYRESNPMDKHIESLVRDVLGRWVREKSGETDVGRVLPAEYLYFWGDGKNNHFTTEFQGGTEWDWSLENPYES